MICPPYSGLLVKRLWSGAQDPGGLPADLSIVSPVVLAQDESDRHVAALQLREIAENVVPFLHDSQLLPARGNVESVEVRVAGSKRVLSPIEPAIETARDGLENQQEFGPAAVADTKDFKVFERSRRVRSGLAACTRRRNRLSPWAQRRRWANSSQPPFVASPASK
jgi:hypothetical protein